MCAWPEESKVNIGIVGYDTTMFARMAHGKQQIYLELV